MNLLNQVLSFLFPEFCRICGLAVESVSDGFVCHACWNSTPVFSDAELTCLKCGLPHGSPRTAAPAFCNECDDDWYDLAVAVGPYSAALSASVVCLKKEPYLPNRVSQLFVDRYQNSRLSIPDIVVPVPLSKRRRFERGFNQAELIARSLSRATGLSLDTKSLIRAKHSKRSRAQMDRRGRRMSVANAFQVKRHRLMEERKILLVDDVMTSGATASMAAKALKKSGAARVELITLARAG